MRCMHSEDYVGQLCVLSSTYPTSQKGIFTCYGGSEVLQEKL